MKIKKKTVSSVKKKAWDAFSVYIRLRDCFGTTGCTSFGLCITCGKRNHFKLLQAGHFLPGRHNANLFSERGTHAQCYNCNINLKGNTLEYRRKIIEMYGVRYDEVIEKRDNEIVKYSIAQLEGMIADYKQRAKQLLGGLE